MTANTGRRPKRPHGTAGSAYIAARIQDRLMEKAATAAASVNLSKSAYIALLIERDQVDDAGRPVWGDEVCPAPSQDVLSGLEKAG